MTITEIKKLRDMTGAGLNVCKESLENSGGDFDKAIQYLRSKGMANSAKRQGNNADNGYIAIYQHSSRFVVVLQLSCETDFAAKSDDFKSFANDLAVQVAATSPTYIDIKSIPEEIINAEKELHIKDIASKEESMSREKFLEERMQKFYSENVLIEQVSFKDNSKTIKDKLNELVAKLGEKIEISFFYKFDIKNGVFCASTK